MGTGEKGTGAPPASAELNQKRLALASQISGIGYWRRDLVTGEHIWSDEVFAMHGVRRGEFPLGDVLRLYVEEDRAGMVAAVERATKVGEPFDLKVRLVRAGDGALRTVHVKGESERDADGNIVALFGVMRDISDEEQLLRRVTASEAMFRELADSSSDVILKTTLDGVIEYCSPAIRAYGYEPEAMVGTHASDLVHPEDRAALLGRVAEMYAGGRPPVSGDRIHRSRTADGRWVWMEGNSTLLRDPEGRATGLLSRLRDVTARVAADRALAESEARYRMLADNATDIIACFGPDTRFTFLSPSIQAVLGYAPEELIGRSTKDLMHPDDYRWSIQAYREQMAAGNARDGFRFDYRARHKDGRIVWLSGHPRAIFDPATGELTGFQDVVRDVTAEKAAEAALAEGEARYRMLADYASDVILKVDAEDVILYASPSVRRYGYEPDELIGRCGYTLVHPDDLGKARRLISELFRSGQVAPERDRTYRVRTADGGYVWMEGNPSLVRNAAGQVEAVISQLRDISVRRALEGELRTARDEAQAAAAAKADFMANMSHEIRTPLTAILGFTSLLAGRADLDKDAQGKVARISAAGQALLAIVNDILDFSKLEAGLMPIAPKPTALRPALADAVALFEPQAQAKGLQLSFTAADLPDHVSLDPDRVRQVLLNLIGNAVKFTDAGQVSVTAAYDPARERLSVAVKDSGAGMDAEQQARLFQRFSQVDGSAAKAGRGTGLGLAISRALVEAMGGEVGLVSAPGEGSTFRIEIPAPTSAAPAASPTADAPPGLAGLRVLLADDNIVNREITRSVLASFEVEVTDVDDGAAAVEMAQALPYDVVLLDIRMPGMDGVEAARRIRGEPGPNRDAPILAFSASHELDPSAARLFDGHVLKPLDVAALLDALARASAWEEALSQAG